MSFLNDMREKSARDELNTNWFKKGINWYIISSGTVYEVPEDNEGNIKGQEHMVKITDQTKKDTVIDYWASKQ